MKGDMLDVMEPAVRAYFRELFLTTRLIQMNFRGPDEKPVQISMTEVLTVASILHHFSKKGSAPGPADVLFLLGKTDDVAKKPLEVVLEPLMDDIDRMAKFGEFEGDDKKPHLSAVPDNPGLDTPKEDS